MLCSALQSLAHPWASLSCSRGAAGAGPFARSIFCPVPPCPRRSIPPGTLQLSLAAASLQSSRAWPGCCRWEMGAIKNEVGEKRSRRWPCEGFCCTLSPLAAGRSYGPRPRRQLRSRSKAADRRQKLQPKSAEQPGLISTTFPGAEPIPLAHLEMFVLRGSSRRLCLGQGLARSSQGRRQ